MKGNSALVSVGNHMADLIREDNTAVAAAADVLAKLDEGNLSDIIQLVLDELHRGFERWPVVSRLRRRRHGLLRRES
jgi:hypothetical protein